VPEVIDMIVAVIIYCGAFALLFKGIMNKIISMPVEEAAAESKDVKTNPVADNTDDIDTKENDTEQKEEL